MRLSTPARMATSVAHLLETEQTLDQRIRIDERVATLGRLGFSRWHEQALFDPHRHVSSGYQPLVVLRPVLDAVDPLGLGLLSVVLAHRPGKSPRHYPASSEVNRASSPAVARKRQPIRPRIYATTPRGVGIYQPDQQMALDSSATSPGAFCGNSGIGGRRGSTRSRRWASSIGCIVRTWLLITLCRRHGCALLRRAACEWCHPARASLGIVCAGPLLRGLDLVHCRSSSLT